MALDCHGMGLYGIASVGFLVITNLLFCLFSIGAGRACMLACACAFAPLSSVGLSLTTLLLQYDI